MRLLRRKKKYLEMHEIAGEVVRDYFHDNTGTCSACGAILAKNKAVLVEVRSFGIRYESYCRRCRPPYDVRITDYEGNTKYFKDTMSRTEVDLDGNPIPSEIKI